MSGTSMTAPHLANMAASKAQNVIAENRFDSSELREVLKVKVELLTETSRDLGREMVYR